MDERKEYSHVLGALIARCSSPKLGLARMRALIDACGFHKTQNIIQVVGTNGKGSTCAFIEAIMMQHGFKTGLFTSPHLASAVERVRVQKTSISRADFVRIGRFVLKTCEDHGIDASFFECMLALALVYFCEQGVHIIILEAGLGGRLDATTAVLADVLGVASIDLDHQHILGKTVAQIATEKLLAARAGQNVVVSPQNPEAHAVVERLRHTIGFTLITSGLCTDPLGLSGQHQKKNADLAVQCCHGLGLNLETSKVRQGLLDVSWPGRMEGITYRGQHFLFDGAHNPHGLGELFASLPQKNYVLVFGTLVSDLACEKIRMVAKNAQQLCPIIVHEPHNDRAMPAHEMVAKFLSYGLSEERVLIYKNIHQVVTVAKDSETPVLVCGSLYTVGHVRSEILGIEQDNILVSY